MNTNEYKSNNVVFVKGKHDLTNGAKYREGCFKGLTDFSIAIL
jgi:hypothetical protein